MNSLARLICLGLVASTGAECDEACAAAAAVSGRILLQQKESIQPMKTVEPETLEEPTFQHTVDGRNPAALGMYEAL